MRHIDVVEIVKTLATSKENIRLEILTRCADSL